MLNYKNYLAEKGIDNNAAIAVLEEHYPKFTKVQASMLSNPERYGLCLLPAAEKVLFTKFGPPAKKSRSAARRTKPNRLVVYLDDDRYRKLIAAKGEASNQDYIAALLERELK